MGTDLIRLFITLVDNQCQECSCKGFVVNVSVLTLKTLGRFGNRWFEIGNLFLEL